MVCLHCGCSLPERHRTCRPCARANRRAYIRAYRDRNRERIKAQARARWRRRRVSKPARFPRWTPAQDNALLAAVEDGRFYRDRASVAAELGRTPDAVWFRWFGVLKKKYGGMPGHTAAACAGLLGVSKATATLWCRRGVLPATEGARRFAGKREWVVTDSEIAAFLADPNYWPLWSVEKLAVRWRAYAREVRTGDLVTVVDAAKRLYVAPETLRTWVRAGKVTAYPRGSKKGWHLRVEDVEELARRLAA